VSTGERTHEAAAELLGAYALNALDPAERELVEAHLDDCPRCRGELRGHMGVAALLGNSGGEAPARVWDRIAEALDEAAPPMRLDLDGSAGRVVPLTAAPSVRRRPRAPGWVLGAAAAAAAAVIAVLGIQVLHQDDRIDTLESALQAEGTAQAAEVALADPDAAIAQLTATGGGAHARAVVLPDGTGYLLAGDLPSLGGDRTYQLWGTTEGGLVSLGLLGAEPGTVVPFQAGRDVTALAITDEAAPGVAQSANAPVVAGPLS
jgi:hypothetical protein